VVTLARMTNVPGVEHATSHRGYARASHPFEGSPTKFAQPSCAILLARTYEYPTGSDIPAHRHSRGQLLGTFRGLMSVGTMRGQWVVPSIHAVWVPPHHYYSMRSHGAFSGYLVSVAENACATLPMELCTIGASALLREAIFRAAAWDEGYMEKEQTHIAMVIVDEIRNLPRQRLGLPMPCDPRVLRIASAIADNPADNRRLEEWASWAGMSTRTMVRRFIAETGLSFTEWRQQARLMRAQELLAADTPVTTVALDLGYETVSGFIAMFRRAFGVTPARYAPRTSSSCRGDQ
jgi:AraC-like DNA-binding protein